MADRVSDGEYWRCRELLAERTQEVKRLTDDCRHILSAAEEVLGFWGIESDEGYAEAMGDLRLAVEIAKVREREAADAE